MIEIIVNDEKKMTDATTITDLLVAESVSMPDMVSVQYNGTILDRAAFSSTILSEGAEVNFLYFMGGGRG